MKIKSPYLIKPHTKVRLAKISSSDTGDFKSEEAAKASSSITAPPSTDLQDVFYASQAKALLIVLQGMDTAGKDGTISHIFSGINPQGCDVAQFKVPTPLEARHDFLWRVHAQVPPRGMIGIFNRSHYEDVLSPRVHKLISSEVADRRLEDINEFESFLADNDVLILKFYLHISQDEQTRRLQARIDDKRKALEALRCRHPRAPVLAPLHRRLQRHPLRHQPQARSLVRHPLRQQVVPQHRHLHDHRRPHAEPQTQIPATHRRRLRHQALAEPTQSSPAAKPHTLLTVIITTAAAATAIPNPCRRVGRSCSVHAASRIVDAG